MNFTQSLLSLEKEQVVSVIIRKPPYFDKAEWIYSYSYIQGLISTFKLKNVGTTVRMKYLKILLDLFGEEQISISTVHAGYIFLYGSSLLEILPHLLTKEITEKKIGKKRLALFSKIPEMRILANEQFMALQYQQMKGTYILNPEMPGIRILFSPLLFEKTFGEKMNNDKIKWIEPKSGKNEFIAHTEE